MDTRFDRGADMALGWADTMDDIMGRRRRSEPFELFRQTELGIGTRANPDGSMTLSAQSAGWATMAGERLLNARYAGQYPDPTLAETRQVRYTVARFGRVYGDMVLPRDRDLSAALKVLDRGLRDNIDLPRMIRESHLELEFAQINNLGDRHPLYQAATRTLTGTLGERMKMEPEELDYLLRRAEPAERFEVLADTLIERDPQQRRLPDGSARTLPPDHLAALKARLVQELDTSFARCEDHAFMGRNTRTVGNQLGAEAVTNLVRHLDEARDNIDSEQRGYAQVSSLVAAVQSELTAGETDYWNGQLHEATLPSEMLGYAGPDRALTFDREKVIDVLATADLTAPPTPEVHAAVDAVASQAAHLCNPSTPGSAAADPVAQAFEDQLRRDFVERQRGHLLAAVGYPDPPRDASSEHSQTATAQVTAALTKKAGQQLRLQPHQVAAELLTTPPDERFAKAAALSLGNQGKVVDRGQWDSATTALAGNIRTTFATAQEADRTGQAKLHAWSRATAGRALSQKLTRAIDKTRRPIDRVSSSADQALRAATTGQALAGSTRAKGVAASTGPAHLPEAGRSERDVSGRG
ncbi:hypothetical protein AB0L70_24140 [Kribbella sp. NPDC051952]|uniref:hypothetical protein n=1 Tax=Kribbella sp. NPDC051952 TaxID=3154851 RepID=UPI00341CAF9B